MLPVDEGKSIQFKHTEVVPKAHNKLQICMQPVTSNLGINTFKTKPSFGLIVFWTRQNAAITVSNLYSLFCFAWLFGQQFIFIFKALCFILMLLLYEGRLAIFEARKTDWMNGSVKPVVLLLRVRSFDRLSWRRFRRTGYTFFGMHKPIVESLR